MYTLHDTGSLVLVESVDDEKLIGMCVINGVHRPEHNVLRPAFLQVPQRIRNIPRMIRVALDHNQLRLWVMGDVAIISVAREGSVPLQMQYDTRGSIWTIKWTVVREDFPNDAICILPFAIVILERCLDCTPICSRVLTQVTGASENDIVQCTLRVE